MRNVLILLAGLVSVISPIMAQSAGDTVKAVVVDQYNVKWFGTDLGLLSYDGTDWKAYQVRVDQPGKVSSLDYVTEAGMLVGTDHGYLETDITSEGIETAYVYNTVSVEMHDQLRDTVITSENVQVILKHVHDVMFDESLRKYVINSDGLAVIDETKRVWLEKGYGLPENGLTLQDPQVLGHEKDSIYIGTRNGVGRVSPYTFKLGYYEDQELVITEDQIDGFTGASHYVQPYSGIASNDVRSMHTDSDGYQWFGTTGGISLHTVQNGLQGWELNLTENDGLVDNTVNAIFQDAAGDLWFGTNGGVSKYEIEGGQFTNYTTSDGLSDNVIYDITEDQDNILWFATANGVSSFNGSTFTAYNTGDQAKDFINVIVNNVLAPLADRNQLKVYPVPARDYIYVHFLKESGLFIEAAVYDVSGKRISRLYSGYAAGGDLKLRWDLTSREGKPVPEGIYFIRLYNGSHVINRKAVVLR